MTVVVKIENDYSDGHHSEHTVEVPAPAERQGELDEWWEDVVYQHTGDGHGIDFDGGSCYTATIVAGPPVLLGETTEWID
jgi:hypothetical protein